MTPSDFIDCEKILIFPGAMGTELQRRGYVTSLPLWSAHANEDANELVARIHRDYFDAGADVAVTNTFRTTPRTYAKTGRRHDARDALKMSVAAAQDSRASISRPTYVAGSFAPLEDCYSPDLVPSATELAHEHGELAWWLADEGVDFLLPETVNALPEAIAMARAASETGLPFLISFVTDDHGGLLDGTSIAQASAATDLPGRFGIALNCRPLETIDSSLPYGLAACDYVGAYPNGIGHPHDALGWIFDDSADTVARFVAAALRWRQAGLRMIGGCCGTTPDYIRALAAAIA